MSNVIQIKHGASAPADGVLAPYELGYADDGGLYIGVPNGDSTISKKINFESDTGSSDGDNSGESGGFEDFSENIYKDDNGDFTIKVGMENLILSNLVTTNQVDYIVTLTTDSNASNRQFRQMANSQFISALNLLTTNGTFIIGKSNYGSDPSNVTDPKEGQLYFVIQE